MLSVPLNFAQIETTDESTTPSGGTVCRPTRRAGVNPDIYARVNDDRDRLLAPCARALPRASSSYPSMVLRAMFSHEYSATR